MPLHPPQLPSKFPCWCQAIYSWGGETKSDLGFVEGDLIECLNAGDGAWWMGRLRRDQRAVGLFPSNFVRVLADDYSPDKARKVSNAALAAAAAKSAATAPQPQKTVFRKPFQGYKEAVGPSEALRQKKDALQRSTAHSVRKRSGTHPARPSSKLQLRRDVSPGAALAPSSARSSRAPSPALSPASHAAPILTATTYVAAPYPPSPLSGTDPRPAAPPACQPFIPQPLRPPSPARSPSRSPVHKPSLSLQSVDPRDAPALAPRQGGRKRSGTFPTLRGGRGALGAGYARLQPPEPLAPATAEMRAPSPSSIFAGGRYAVYEEEEGYEGEDGFGYHDGEGEGAMPPPPPPPHRVSADAYLERPGSAGMMGAGERQYESSLRTPSPAVSGRRSGEYGTTPSPLRDAMEDVISSLQDMGVPRDSARSTQGSPAAYRPWSSRDFRPDSSRPLAINGSSARPSSEFNHNDITSHAGSPHDRFQDGPPQLNNYVQRMESRLRQLHAQNARNRSDELHLPKDSEANDTVAPLPPPTRTTNHMQMYDTSSLSTHSSLAKRRSAFDVIDRHGTTRSTATNSSSGMQSVVTTSSSSTGATGNHSLMSGLSAGAFSATSAGSYARRGGGHRPNTSMDVYPSMGRRPRSPTHKPLTSRHDTALSATPSSTPSSAHNPSLSSSSTSDLKSRDPLKKKSGFFRKMIETAKSSAATARGSVAGGVLSPSKSRLGSAFSHSRAGTRSSAKDAAAAGSGTAEWIQARRDVARASTPSKLELIDKAERCQMQDVPVIYAIEDLYTTVEGDEGIDGLPIEEPTNWAGVNMGMVDKAARYLGGMPGTLSPAVLAQSYVCRAQRTDGQRLRAVFTWVTENVIWEEDVGEEVDVRRVIQMRRGSAREVAVLVQEMCSAIGIHSEVVEGYLKTPGEDLDLDSLVCPNHYWNTILVDGEWRIMDCSLASPTHPARTLYSNVDLHVAESWYFLARPMEICYSHVPTNPEQQHLVPPVATDILLALPSVTPIYFQCNLSFTAYDTSLTRIEGLETVQIRVEAPFDVECTAEVETQALSQDVDGNIYESGEVAVKRALSQPDWCQGRKRFTIKAVLPPGEDRGVLKVYAGKRGLMHTNKDMPYPLAFALPIVHAGENPPFDFVLRHPTPHAQHRDLYIVQPQCARLAANNTFVFTVRQHPASLFPALPSSADGSFRTASPSNRPPSSLSVVSSLAHHSNSSSSSYSQQPFSLPSSNVSSTSGSSLYRKPAKLAIQAPSGKILRLTRKTDGASGVGVQDPSEEPDGSLWETVVKVVERGTWRALVLADRSNRWCVWAEWECA